MGHFPNQPKMANYARIFLKSLSKSIVLQIDFRKVYRCQKRFSSAEEEYKFQSGECKTRNQDELVLFRKNEIECPALLQLLHPNLGLSDTFLPPICFSVSAPASGMEFSEISSSDKC